MIEGDVQLTTGRQFYLLGLMHGHFDIADLTYDAVVDDPRDASAGINSGVGVVIPIEKIIETIEHPDLMEARRKVAIEERKKNGATPDILAEPSDGADGERDATEANPRHREDFNRLVGAAARRHPPSGQT
jgi:hypothetical protein